MNKIENSELVETETLRQDPHKVKSGKEKVLEIAVGREIRAIRLQQNITVAELSNQTGISIGMLSKMKMVSPHHH